MSKLFHGTAVAITTPFKEGVVDYDTFERHIEFLLTNDIKALFVNGTTGEGSTLTKEEQIRLVETAVKVTAGRVPVYVGSGTNDTQASIQQSLNVKAAGADGIMLITPYYNKTNQRGLIAHFTAIADAVELPVILYNVPSRTNVTIEPETVKELAAHPHIAALKDATGDMQYFEAVKSLVPDDFALYSGNDDSFIEFLDHGGDGIISVAANAVPKEFQTIYEVYQQDPSQAGDMYAGVSPLIEALNIDINPMPIKALVTYLGFADGSLRLPLVALPPHETKAVIHMYQQLKDGIL
ncbi:4-hydroxy-tetrahydrodipicolinate synthase [Macrococcus equipercicus]|uniref:4-hydroxy-tetrahydrodipicolinate synthase n=1 Tax=Macrococcus equipercicus TaxID=69967 RepID=A0ABQ6RAC3_9STAP|nr:4-hydroxy-tetrahydrodipicolinate synthase [Macrococcus equipercicus]KAA1040254.1 4-hydroxy-tetrahydrodipicolinate synthase [Macrococcus equipercicus]